MAKPTLNLDPNHIADFLNEPNIESSTPSVSTLLPPLPCRMVITLDEVIAYDRNPRRSINPNYESIKESIRNRGLDDEPTITRRSIDEPFMIRSGGNTRLAILGDLYKEYSALAQKAEEAGNLEEAQQFRIKADEFYRFEWSYKPWEGETSALIGHMAENEERGDMIYIEKALAVKELQDIFNEGEKKPLSARKLAIKISSYGWSLGNSSVSLMIYTVELNQYLEKALWAGLGKDSISKIRTIHRAYSKFCGSQKITTTKFNDIWQKVLTTCDDEYLDINNTIRRYADQLISDEINVEYFTVTAEIDAILSGNKPAIRKVPLTQDEMDNNQTTGSGSTNTSNVVDFNGSQSSGDSKETSESNNKNPEKSSNSKKTENKTKKPAEPITLEKLNELRQQLYVDVVTLGLPFELAHYVNKSQSGLGFFIDPIVEEAYTTKADIVDGPEQLNRNALWLYLKQLSLHNLFLAGGELIPTEQAVSGSELTPEVFFTLNSHFHLMRLIDAEIQAGVNVIEQSIRNLIEAADTFYGGNGLHQLFTG